MTGGKQLDSKKGLDASITAGIVNRYFSFLCANLVDTLNYLETHLLTNETHLILALPLPLPYSPLPLFLGNFDF